MIYKQKQLKKIPSYENYYISDDGSIILNTKLNREMSTWVHEINNYKSTLVQLTNKQGIRKHWKVHRLVALAWLSKQPSERHNQINHKNGNSLDNHYSNLEWCTKSLNQRHAVKTGLKGKGQELYNSTLTDKQVKEICNKLSNGAIVKDLSETYAVSKDIIRKIKAGDTYFHIRKHYKIPHKYKNNFSESTIKWVCERILDGYGDREICELSTNPNLFIIEIKRIRNKTRYKYISDNYFK